MKVLEYFQYSAYNKTMFLIFKLVKWLVIFAIYAGIAFYSYQFLTGFFSDSSAKKGAAAVELIKKPVMDKIRGMIGGDSGSKGINNKGVNKLEAKQLIENLSKTDIENMINNKEVRNLVEESGLKQLMNDDKVAEILKDPAIMEHLKSQRSKLTDKELKDMQNNPDISEIFKLLQEAK